MKVHEALAKAVFDHGAETMFGLIGDANLYMVDSYIRSRGGRYISAVNEAGAVLMALGYAQVSSQIGVATVTHGPAMLNTLNALVEAVKASMPLVILCGDTPIEDREHIQNVSQREFIIAAGAGFEQLRAPETVWEDTATAFRRARVERRPIVLNMPVDFQWMEAEDQSSTKHFVPGLDGFVSQGDQMDNAVGIIAAAKRPIILAGRGACEPAARDSLIRLADRIEGLLATTLKAKGLFSGHPFNIGIFGTLSTPVANELILGSDCIVAFGAGLNKYTAGSGSLIRSKRIIQVNPDARELGRNVAPDAGLVGDAGLIADRIVHWLDQAEIGPSGARTEAVREAISGYKIERRQKLEPSPGTVDIREFLVALNEAMPADRVLVTDAGRFLIETWRHVDVKDPRDFVFTVNTGSIGFGIGEAIGAAAAAQGRTTLLITGDGGLMLGGLSEFNSAVRAKSDLIVVVCNDGSYGAEHIQFRSKQMDPSLSQFDWPDFAPVAAALGGFGVTVRSSADTKQAMDAIRSPQRPLLIDVKLDPDQVPVIGH